MRKHFLESLERTINFQNEYLKLEKMICIEKINDYYNTITINSWIEKNFRLWKKRKSYISFQEVRNQIGFKVDVLRRVFANNVGMNEYYLFCEMIFNILKDLSQTDYVKMSETINHQIMDIFDTANAVIGRAGFEWKHINDQWIIVEKNAEALVVADIVEPELADVIVEYNHYLLHGDLNRKQELLKKLADALEPKRNELSSIRKQETDDFFFMVNNMNVRHNNCDSSDSKKYNKAFAMLSLKDKESWYDKIYEQGLALYVSLDQKDRSDEIKKFKMSMSN